ncbi:TPA: DUF378 domain-containing protein [Patescibacteria group bacterium]|uniref:DUF378 domain-containing protein n=1 Tax=candidate division Kazan bacterium GW2011_GWA1_44_22 TaxID=1620410 RepID=A0A0G1I2L7_UNCK3|nr:MAG: hypothetical protein VE96_C0003G0013 [candidate division Kazan bacterium GW2011_GWA1_44_22]HAR54791.1 DUF378 domain-containing protein [Patescibacteria group bacterium]HCR42057.1 DUF378 domain-containing protein [Patescibacteria group bacterium]
MNTVKWIAMILMVIGALNWGLIGFFGGFDLVATIFQEGSLLTTIVYDLVGLSAVYALFWILPKMK